MLAPAQQFDHCARTRAQPASKAGHRLVILRSIGPPESRIHFRADMERRAFGQPEMREPEVQIGRIWSKPPASRQSWPSGTCSQVPNSPESDSPAGNGKIAAAADCPLFVGGEFRRNVGGRQRDLLDGSDGQDDSWKLSGGARQRALQAGVSPPGGKIVCKSERPAPRGSI